MFGYKSKAQKRKEKARTITGWTIVALFLIGVSETVYKKFTSKNDERDDAIDYNEWSGRG